MRHLRDRVFSRDSPCAACPSPSERSRACLSVSDTFFGVFRSGTVDARTFDRPYTPMTRTSGRSHAAENALKPQHAISFPVVIASPFIDLSEFHNQGPGSACQGTFFSSFEKRRVLCRNEIITPPRNRPAGSFQAGEEVAGGRSVWERFGSDDHCPMIQPNPRVTLEGIHRAHKLHAWLLTRAPSLYEPDNSLTVTDVVENRWGS